MKKVNNLSQIKKQREDFINFANFAKSYQSPPKVSDAWELWITKQENLKLEEELKQKNDDNITNFLVRYGKLTDALTGKKTTHAFFYSEKQKKVLDTCKTLFNQYPQTISLYRGMEYTEMREMKYGWSNWDDAILIGFGNYNDIEIVNK